VSGLALHNMPCFVSNVPLHPALREDEEDGYAWVLCIRRCMPLSTERVLWVRYVTRLMPTRLQASLGGNTKTTLVVCCSVHVRTTQPSVEASLDARAPTSTLPAITSPSAHDMTG
jgi:hypothetical protein